MGLKQKVEELERRLEAAQRKNALLDETIDYIFTLAQMPEDAALLYTLHDIRISHQIGKSARVLLGKLNESTHHRW